MEDGHLLPQHKSLSTSGSRAAFILGGLLQILSRHARTHKVNYWVFPYNGSGHTHAPTVVYPSEMDGVPKISIPTFAMASYKLKGSIWMKKGVVETQQVSSLLQAADNWLRLVQVNHPDFQFFKSHAVQNMKPISSNEFVEIAKVEKKKKKKNCLIRRENYQISGESKWMKYYDFAVLRKPNFGTISGDHDVALMMGEMVVELQGNRIQCSEVYDMLEHGFVRNSSHGFGYKKR
ncbi:unnamed protein product [Sphenostylis stenocarpa]|uniref:Uncharacterized protein n=1 Tax=Sphenostylis stenocarpa TaxID=92480 RepID=A0AA86V5X3_9FABA|nr:unnamed protein product [Sphenostylis stenocarpa]